MFNRHESEKNVVKFRFMVYYINETYYIRLILLVFGGGFMSSVIEKRRKVLINTAYFALILAVAFAA